MERNLTKHDEEQSQSSGTSHKLMHDKTRALEHEIKIVLSSKPI